MSVRLHPGHAQFTAGVGGAQPSAEWKQVCLPKNQWHSIQLPMKTQPLLRGHPAGNFTPSKTWAPAPTSMARAQSPRAQSPPGSVPNPTGIFTPSAPQAAVPAMTSSPSPATPLSIRAPEQMQISGHHQGVRVAAKHIPLFPDSSAPCDTSGHGNWQAGYPSPTPLLDRSGARHFTGPQQDDFARPGPLCTAASLEKTTRLTVSPTECVSSHHMHSHVHRRYSCPLPSSTPSSGKGFLFSAPAVITTSESSNCHAHARHRCPPRSPVPPSQKVASAHTAAVASVGPNQEPSHAKLRQVYRSQSPPTSPVPIFRNVELTEQRCSHTLSRHAKQARHVVEPPAPTAASVVMDSECSHIQRLQACFLPSPIQSPMPSPWNMSSASATNMAGLAGQRCLHLQSRGTSHTPRGTCHTPSPLPQAGDAATVVGAAAPEGPEHEPVHVATQACCTPKLMPQSRDMASSTAAAATAEADQVVANTDGERERESSQSHPRRTCPAPSSVPDSENEILEAGAAASLVRGRSRPQPGHTGLPSSPTISYRNKIKVGSSRASSFDSGDQFGQGGSRTASKGSRNSDKAAPLAHTASSKRCATKLTCRDSPSVASRRVKNTHTPQRNSLPAAFEFGRPSFYPRLGSEGSCIIRHRSGFRDEHKDLNASVDAGSAEDVLQRSVDRPAESSSMSEQLLTAWMYKRHTTESLCAEEANLVKDIFFETMPSDKVKIIRIDRMMQPELINSFCREEVESIARERENQRRHKEFMFLHGTRWENVPLICSMGLDPDCGNLSKGSWLGQNAGSAHAYASKGPGPGPFHDGHKLFAMFVVACLPSYADGDEERSFGVWRIMSKKRMCPAYLVIYSAPQSMRVQRQIRFTSRSPSPETLLQPCHERQHSPVKELGTEATTGVLDLDSSPENSPHLDEQQVSLS